MKINEPNPLTIIDPSSALALPVFYQLADVPPELEFFGNIENPGTRRVYKNCIRDFMKFFGISRPPEFRDVTRAHVIAWRDDLKKRGLSATTITRLTAQWMPGGYYVATP